MKGFKNTTKMTHDAKHLSQGGAVKPVGRDAMVGNAVGYPMKGGKIEAVGAPIKKARGGMLQNVEAMNTRQVRQMARNNPDLANRAARLADMAQLRTDLGNLPGTSAPKRPSLVGVNAPSPMGYKKGGKVARTKVLKKADGGSVGKPMPGAAPTYPDKDADFWSHDSVEGGRPGTDKSELALRDLADMAGDTSRVAQAYRLRAENIENSNAATAKAKQAIKLSQLKAAAEKPGATLYDRARFAVAQATGFKKGGAVAKKANPKPGFNANPMVGYKKGGKTGC